ncbi:MAG: preprotein translocase subunit SecE [Eubacteriaceae bacterium]|nr:preprotein translocase subunit SecE [Eubacteriaceae bacterium]MBR0383801.1 preprotein translocase subunit SecE [Eubacteriaceae bacterium]
MAQQQNKKRKKKNTAKPTKKKQNVKVEVSPEKLDGEKETIVVSKKNEVAKSEKKTKSEKTKPTKKAARNEKPGLFMRGINFLKDVRTELKKVTWLTPDELMKSTGVVAGIVTLATLYTWIIDSGLGALAAMILGNK